MFNLGVGAGRNGGLLQRRFLMHDRAAKGEKVDFWLISAVTYQIVL
jgi:hypothetical protein